MALSLPRDDPHYLNAAAIMYQFKNLQRESPVFYRVEPVGDDIFHWEGTMMGPPDTPYSGGVFHIDIRFPFVYPFQAVEVKFKTKIFHPNINENGIFCHELLKQQWTPAWNISKMLLNIYSFLSDPDLDSPLESDVARLYKTDKAKYEETAKSWTRKYAMGGSDLDSPTDMGGSDLDRPREIERVIDNFF